MREEFRPVVVEHKWFYIADDGTEFRNKEECEYYEIRKQYTKEQRNEILDEYIGFLEKHNKKGYYKIAIIKKKIEKDNLIVKALLNFYNKDYYSSYKYIYNYLINNYGYIDKGVIFKEERTNTRYYWYKYSSYKEICNEIMEKIEVYRLCKKAFNER